MKQRMVPLLMAATLAMLASPAHAADGAVCYTGLYSQTTTGGLGTTSYPQLSNTSKFNCGWATTYTIKELSQAGWIVAGAPQALIYSMTTNADGSITSRTRFMIVIQK